MAKVSMAWQGEHKTYSTTKSGIVSSFILVISLFLDAQLSIRCNVTLVNCFLLKTYANFVCFYVC